MNSLMRRSFLRSSTGGGNKLGGEATNENAMFIVYCRFGNFEVIEKLYQYIPEAVEGKAHLDHVIDLCGTPKEGGTGLQNLRECIVWTEEKFNFEPKLKKVRMDKVLTTYIHIIKYFLLQPFWKQMSKNFIERYCYLIVFATYLRERAPR